MPDYDLEAINADWPKVNQLRRMTDPDQLIAWCARATLQFADPRILDDPPTKIPDGVDLQGAVEAAADNHIVAYLLDDDPAFHRLYSTALTRASKKRSGRL